MESNQSFSHLYWRLHKGSECAGQNRSTYCQMCSNKSTNKKHNFSRTEESEIERDKWMCLIRAWDWKEKKNHNKSWGENAWSRIEERERETYREEGGGTYLCERSMSSPLLTFSLSDDHHACSAKMAQRMCFCLRFWVTLSGVECFKWNSTFSY